MSVSTEIVVLLLLVLANGFLAMAEIAVVAARGSRLRGMADAGNRGAELALGLRADPGRFLSTVQVGISSVAILAGAFGGATVADELATLLKSHPPLAPVADATSLAVVVILVTYLSVVLGELVPKQVALDRPEALAARSSRVLRLLSRIAAPAVWLLDASAGAILRLIGVSPTEEGPPISDEELRHLLEVGRRTGVLQAAEKETLERALRLGDRTVGELVIPRIDLVALGLSDSTEEILAKVAASDQTLFPVYGESPDDLVGTITLRELLLRLGAGEPLDLDEGFETPLFLPETLPVFAALDRFRRLRVDGALVFDEYGGLEGMVTLREILEAIVGELPTPIEEGPLLVERPDDSLLVDGILSTGELADALELSPEERETIETSRTVAGFVLDRLGRIPETGDAFDWKSYRLEVVDMDRRRIDKVLVVPLSEPDGDRSED